MEFIDHTGHIFSLPTFDDKPVAIQYTESDYIFWIKDNPVSINNYYILPIRFLLDYDIYVTKLLKLLEDDDEHQLSLEDMLQMTITLNSNFYKLIGPKYIQSKIEQNKDINEPIQFDLNDFKNELKLDDFYFELSNNSDQNIIVYNGDKKFIMFPFYVIGTSVEEGTYLSNILINIKTYDQESEEQKIVWLDQEQMYDYLMKKTFDTIKIYEINTTTGEKTLWYELQNGYNPSINEIITIYQQEYKYRIRNWSYGNIRSDVYHYIYKLPKDKWLQPNHHYVFSGYIKQSCHYCGSNLHYNHDGYMTSNEYNLSYKYWVPTPNCLLDLDGTPFYSEAYDYDEITNTYIPKDNQLFHLGTLPRNFYENHSYGDDFHFTDAIFTPNTIIRDLFFDVDNKDVTENKDGGYIEYKYYAEKNEYTQITVGCTFIDENEELIINGKNMGINLPKEILKAIYSSSFYNKYADEKLLKTKMKELLLNYMSIKGECGNFKSVINSLKWFGWHDKIEISKLIKTDNEFQNQYILDYFNITTDLKDTYKYFNTTNLISLSIKGNKETNEYDIQDFSGILIGEGKPLLEDLFNKNVEVTYDELKFYKPYYDFMFNELALKLDCLSYYWQKYFLPIHLKINRASIEYKVYANDMKLSCAAFQKIIEKPVIVHTNNDKEYIPNVVFPNSTKLIYNKSIHYIDSKFNEFSNYNDNFTNEELYYVNENCIVIPLKIEDLKSQYSKNDNGEYILINGEYIKPFKFFKYNVDNNYLEEITNINEADYYQLYYNSDYVEFTGNEDRYSKISTDYYNCRIFLSYIDNETNEEKYLVKDNAFTFYQSIDQYYCNYIIVPRLMKDLAIQYNSRLTKMFDSSNPLDDNEVFIYNSILGTNKSIGDILTNEEADLFNKNIKNGLNSSNELTDIEARIFNIVMGDNKEEGDILSYKEAYMFNSKLKGAINIESLDNIDWLATYFRLAIVVNNKWFTYDFTIHTPNIYLDLGKLNYRYYIGDNTTMFNQINKMTSLLDSNTNQEIVKIDFKSFLYQPDLVSIDTLFYDKDKDKVLTFIQKLIDTNGDQNIIYDFYKQYYQKSIKIQYNPKYYNKVHIFDLCKRVEIDDLEYDDLPDWWGNEYGDQVDDEEWNESEKVIEFIQNNPDAYFESGTLPNFSNLYNVTSTLAEEFIYDFDFPVFGINNAVIINSRDPWDMTETESPQSIDNHGSFEDGIRAFAKWMLVDLYAPDNQPQRIIQYIYHIYEFEIYDDNHKLIYHAKSRKSVDDLKQIINQQIQYRMWNHSHAGQSLENNPYQDWKLSNRNDPYKILHYYDAIKVENPESEIQKEKYEHTDYSENLTYKESQYYKLLFNNDGSQKININENIEYDIYLMHDNVIKENKYWYAVLISKYPISNYTEDELAIHKEEYILDDASGLMLKYSGYSLDKFLVNRMDIIPSNGYNHFNDDDLIIATINNNNYQFNIDLSSKWNIQRAYDEYDNTLVMSNTNTIIIPTNNIDNLYKPGYYNINLEYSINGLNDQLYSANGRYLVTKEKINISYPIIKTVINKQEKISIDTIISDFSILYENANGQRKSTPNILKKSSGWVPIGIKIVNAGYFDPKSPDIYMGLKLMCCGDPDNGFAGQGSRIYYIDQNGSKVTDINPYWGFYQKDLNALQYFDRICYIDETKSRSTYYVYPQTDDWTKIPVDESGNPRYPAPNNRGFKYSKDTNSTYIVNLLNDDDTLNVNLIDDLCAVSDWNGKLNTEKLISQFDPLFQPNWKTDSTINNVYNQKFSAAAACCWRYHTLTTKQGDWYLPAFAEVFFISYNFKKYSEVFEQLAELYPESCKLDLIKCIGSSALWSSTSESRNEAWEIHPCQHAHSLSKSTTGWYTIPFIQIVDKQDNGNGGHSDQNDYSNYYLTFTATSAGSFSFSKSGLLYSIDEGKTWEELIGNSPIIEHDNKIMFKGELRQESSYMNSDDSGIGQFSSSSTFKVSGNILSLIYGDNIDDRPEIDMSFMFNKLFKNCVYLEDAKDLQLPLDPVPVLGYSEMFNGCTSLINPPRLPALNLSTLCYNEMFEDCTLLPYTPILQATTLAPQCYYGMFKGCTSLQTITTLPATTLTNNCYQYMFWNCQNIRVAPLLDAEELAPNCYYGMFTYCRSLITPPNLPATELKEYCYKEMFSGCTSLLKAPTLPAEHLVKECYYKMFEGCNKLNQIKALFLDEFVLDDNNYTTDWVSGVSLTGTFIKNPNAIWQNKFDLYAIPPGWTVVTEEDM